MKPIQLDNIIFIFILSCTIAVMYYCYRPQQESKLPQGLHRAENHEVVCYGMHGMGVWCTLKQPVFKVIN